MTQQEFEEVYKEIEKGDLINILILVDEIYNFAQPKELDSFIKKNAKIIIDLSDHKDKEALAEKIDEIVVALGDLFVKEDDRSDEINQALVSFLCGKYNQNLFWDAIVKIANQSVTPYFETKFLRSYALEKRKSIYSCAMDMAIVRVESEDVVLKEIGVLGIDKAQFNTIVKLMNTLVDAVISKGRAYSSWKEYSQNVFYLENEDSRFIWEIIVSNRLDLYQRTVMRKIQELEINFLSMKDDVKELSSRAELYSETLDKMNLAD